MRSGKIALAATTYSIACLILSFCLVYLAHNIVATSIFTVAIIPIKSVWIIASAFVIFAQGKIWQCAVNTINDLEPRKE